MNTEQVIKLTDKQEKFCLEYMIDLNATQAAIRAGYSPKTASEMGYENLNKPQIIDRIAQMKEEGYSRARKSRDDIIRELENIGFSRLGKVVSWNESGPSMLKSSEDIDDDTHAALESIEITEDFVGKGDDARAVLKTKVKLHNKLPALQQLAKHHNIGTEETLNLKGEGLGSVLDWMASKKGGE
jgi:phage terminase small subunit